MADGTIGGGGHAEAILEATSPDGWLYGCDRDPAALAAARARLARFAGRFELRQLNFADLAEWIELESCDGVLLDLGVSSSQLDRPERGFSFQHDALLDMRMNPTEGPTAAELVNTLSESELAEMFWKYGGEPQARRIARAIVRQREQHRLESTGELARLVERVVPRQGKKRHPATLVFQALRIMTNNEIGSLRSGLAAACLIARSKARIAVISFNSLEDRTVKEFGREKSRDYTVPGTIDVPELRQPAEPVLRVINRKAIQPTEEEIANNPRARSAQLRVFEKI
jgi:16S rRNA (cytosine1402-N4)-methyltransferase